MDRAHPAVAIFAYVAVIAEYLITRRKSLSLQVNVDPRPGLTDLLSMLTPSSLNMVYGEHLLLSFTAASTYVPTIILKYLIFCFIPVLSLPY